MSNHSMNRRDFIKGMAAVGALSAVGSSAFAKADKQLPIGIQLYTVRSKSSVDFKGTLEQVADIGYPAFEFAGYGGMTAGEMNAFLQEIGVVTCGSHEGYNNFIKDADKVIEYNAALGNPYITIPSMPQHVRNGSAGIIKQFGDNLNKFGYKVKQAGMQLCYHNHSFEFELVDGKTIFDHLMQATDSDMVKCEFDLAWIVNAGVDPIDLMEQYAHRLELLHMKDLSKDKKLAPVGTGTVPFKKIIRKAKKIGVKWYIVEQDRTREGRDIMDEIAISYNNLAKLL